MIYHICLVIFIWTNIYKAMSPNPAQMLGASFDFYTGEVADMDAIGPELNATWSSRGA